MNPLTCDVCGGALTMQAGGTTAVCSVCGMQYSVERLREKVGAKRSAKPSTNTEQWRDLVKKYYAAGDFRGAEALVKKILEQTPSDTQANRWYEELQDLKYMDVRNGVLVKYTGSSKHVHIPNCITQIGARAFESNQLLTTVVIPDSVAVIGYYAFMGCKSLTRITIPDSVTQIVEWAFCGCEALTSVSIPKNVTIIESGTFCGCKSLASVVIPDGVTSIGSAAFNGCKSLTSVVIPNSVTEIEFCAFGECDNITSLQIRKELIRSEIFRSLDSENSYYIKWYEDYWRECDKQKERLSKAWKRQGRCRYCGGELTGLFSKRCIKCGSTQ